MTSSQEERAGVWLTSTNTMITELVGNWSTPAGEHMMPVLFASAPMLWRAMVDEESA